MQIEKLKIGELFAGYGGLGAGVMELLDAEVAWVSEFDKHPSMILTHRFPDAPNLGDITKIDWATVEPVDIITGGSPCQDLSHAGQRLGMKHGTRSGLWVNMLKAIKTIRPKLVVWENVGGAFSAEATSEMEPCPGCVGHGDGGPILRALGRVLGDLTEAGYDAEWHSLRAADIGAPHGRLRVFVTAWPRETGKPRLAGRALVSDTHDSRRSEQRGAIPSPPEHATLERNLSLLPAPAVNDMGTAYDPETWDQWTARMKAAHGNGNGHGKSLNIEALRMLPTPRATDGTKGGPNQRGSKGDLMLPSLVMNLLPTPNTANNENRQSEGYGPNLGGALSLLPTPTSERPDGRKSDAFREGRTNFFDVIEQDQWGEYTPAIARWESVLGRPAPDPTLPTGRGGKHQLSARFVEWMMGLPDGWVTGDIVSVWCKNLEERKAGEDPRPVGMRGSILRFVPITRNAQLKALGNGVVPQQAAEALRRTLDPTRVFFNA